MKNIIIILGVIVFIADGCGQKGNKQQTSVVVKEHGLNRYLKREFG